MKAISEKSFNNIKRIAKALQEEVNYNKKHGLDNTDDIDFSNLNNPKFDDSNYEVGEAITEEDAIYYATNLNVHINDDDIVIDYADWDYPNDDVLNVKDVLDIINDLIKLGRKGINARIIKCDKIRNKISKLQGMLEM